MLKIGKIANPTNENRKKTGIDISIYGMLPYRKSSNKRPGIYSYNRSEPAAFIRDLAFI